LSPSYPAFMQELLHFTVAGRLREHAAVVGDTLEEFLPLGSAGLEASIQTPDGRTHEERTKSQEDAAVFRFAGTDQSGVYRAAIGQHPQEYLFAVNVPVATETQQSTESDPARTNRNELQDAYPNCEFQLVTELKDVVHAGGSGAGEGAAIVHGVGTRIARLLMLLFLALLLIEIVLAWRFGHWTTAGPAGAIPATGRILPIAVGVLAGLLFVALAGVLAHAAYTGDFLGFMPESLRAAAERALDVPPPDAGEGTRWRLDYTPYLSSDFRSEAWWVGGIAVAALVVVFSIYLREGRTAGRTYKLLLAGLRGIFVLLTLAVLLPQLRVWFERQGWPELAIIIDDSKSMSVADQYQDTQIREAAEQLAQVTSLSTPHRLQLAKALLTRSELNWLEALITRRKVKVHVYHCSGRAARLADVTEPNQVDAAIQSVHGLEPEGESSELGAAVRQVLNDFRGSSLAAVVMLTDGVTTEGEDLVQASRYAAQTGVPLFFVGIGEAREARDLILHDLQVEDTVFVNDRLVFEARLTGQGYTSLTVPVTLYEKKEGTLRALKTQPVTVDPHGKPVKFRIVHQPTEAGEKVYVLDVPEQADEVKPPDNNRIERRVMVQKARPIRVLYVEGYPRYEYRFLKTLLERETPDEKGNRTLELRVLLLDADDDYPEQDRTSLAEFPTRDELGQYQVLILGDVDPKHPKLEKSLKDVADFVRERGGGLLLLAGEFHNPHAFKHTLLREILPVEPLYAERPEAGADIADGFRPELTPVGRAHPIFRFSPDEADNVRTWNELPELFWSAERYRLQPAAEVLAVHPARPAFDSRRAAGGDDRHPLIVQQFVGAGRCMFFGIDETWRWRYREHEVQYTQFWIQTMRYLARSRLGRIDLRLDRQTNYRRGEPIRVSVRFPDDVPPPAPNIEVKVVVERRPPRVPGQLPVAAPAEVQTLQLAKVEGSRATYEALLTQTPEGEYRFWLSSPPGARPEVECRVLAPPAEMENLRMNQQDMERAAGQSNGRFYTLADADKLISELPTGTRISLNTPRPPLLVWNHVAMCLLAMSLLTSEWILRKRKHLL
ncbi:MAG TPA: vWA domain-containing protein, partial [Gemmataceae bacterium]|nr:vWA domain-containing protein [Gemmataceae bacterium]